MPSSPVMPAEYSVGHEILDQQHQHLFSLFDVCERLVKNQNDAEFPEKFNHLLVDLTDYAKEHFRYEEKLMLEVKYPNLRIHQGEHDAYISGLNNIIFEARQGKLNINRLRSFLSVWLISHILESDMKFKYYILKK